MIKTVTKADGSSGEAYCIILCTIEIFEFLKKLFERGEDISCEIDGTYRLTDIGWVVSTIITHDVRYNQSSTNYKHSGLPMGFMVTYTEATEVYTEFIDVIINLPSTHMNKGHGAKLLLSVVGQDRASEIRVASRKVIGDRLITVTCNVHIIRKHKDKSVISIQKKENEKTIVRHLRCHC